MANGQIRYEDMFPDLSDEIRLLRSQGIGDVQLGKILARAAQISREQGVELSRSPEALSRAATPSPGFFRRIEKGFTGTLTFGETGLPFEAEKPSPEFLGIPSPFTGAGAAATAQTIGEVAAFTLLAGALWLAWIISKLLGKWRREEAMEIHKRRRKGMNAKQKQVVMIGIVLIALMGLIPPWTCQFRVGEFKAGGYAFIFDPPSGGPCFIGAEVNISRLLVQWLGVCLVAGGLVWVFKDEGS